MNFIKNPYSEFIDPVNAEQWKKIRPSSELNTKEVLDEVGQYFTQSSFFIRALCRAFRTGTNIWLDGVGGYGKSDISYAFGHYLYKNKFISKPPFVFSCSKSVTEDVLFGGIDVKKYKEESLIHYKVENSPFNFDYVIWEEFGDLSDDAIRALKDTLSSKHIRNGTQLFKCKTTCHVACGNVNIKEFKEAGDDLEALTQRFTQDMRVSWADHSIDSYMQFFKVKGADDFLAKYLAEFCFMVNNNGYLPDLKSKYVEEPEENVKITPRKAWQLFYMTSMEGGNPLKSNYFDCAQFMGDFGEYLPKFRSYYADKIKNQTVLKMFENNLSGKYEKMMSTIESNKNPIRQYKIMLSIIKDMQREKAYATSELGTIEIAKIAQQYENKINKSIKKLKKEEEERKQREIDKMLKKQFEF